MKTSLKLYLTALVASFLLLLGACSTNTNSSTNQTETSSSAPTKITIKSSLDEVKLSKVPEKIVTFDLGAADTIRALGFEKNIVGMPTKTVPTYLKDLAGNVNNVGSMVEPDLEAIAALEPNLIIASPRTQKFVDKFKEIAPTVLFQADKDDYWTFTKANIFYTGLGGCNGIGGDRGSCSFGIGNKIKGCWSRFLCNRIGRGDDFFDCIGFEFCRLNRQLSGQVGAVRAT